MPMLVKMRTTVEITDAQHVSLLKLAAERGEKGFSRLVQEAIAQFLDRVDANQTRVHEALSVLGTLDDAEGAAFQERTQALRSSWR